MPTSTETALLDRVDERIRSREARAHPSDTTLLSAMVAARLDSGAGLELEHACPYV
jgi:hypothetical protein